MNRAAIFSIGLAISSDGLHWEKVGKVFGPGEPGSFDECGAGTRHVIRIGDEYAMFYEGVSSTKFTAGSSIGVALSGDGIHWSRDAEPVFTPAEKGSGLWDAGTVGTPCVVPLDDGSFRLYYIGANEGGRDELSLRHQIGLAVSDGPNFRRWRRWSG